MRKDQEISHEGRIISITPEFTTVEIWSESGCAPCHAASLCGMSETKRKEIELPTTLGDWEVGQTVLVNLKRSMGIKAVWLAYVLPLVVLVACIILLSGTGRGELFIGLVSIAAVAVYYLILFLFRDRLRNEYSFYIKKK